MNLKDINPDNVYDALCKSMTRQSPYMQGLPLATWAPSVAKELMDNPPTNVKNKVLRVLRKLVKSGRAKYYVNPRGYTETTQFIPVL